MPFCADNPKKTNRNKPDVRSRHADPARTSSGRFVCKPAHFDDSPRKEEAQALASDKAATKSARMRLSLGEDSRTNKCQSQARNICRNDGNNQECDATRHAAGQQATKTHVPSEAEETSSCNYSYQSANEEPCEEDDFDHDGQVGVEVEVEEVNNELDPTEMRKNVILPSGLPARLRLETSVPLGSVDSDDLTSNLVTALRALDPAITVNTAKNLATKTLHIITAYPEKAQKCPLCNIGVHQAGFYGPSQRLYPLADFKGLPFKDGTCNSYLHIKKRVYEALLVAVLSFTDDLQEGACVHQFCGAQLVCNLGCSNHCNTICIVVNTMLHFRSFFCSNDLKSHCMFSGLRRGNGCVLS